MSQQFQPFTESIQNICDKVTFCTLDLYKSIIADLRPTPSKFHYIFNLRDLSRVYNGLTLTGPDRFYPTFHFEGLLNVSVCIHFWVFPHQIFNCVPICARLEERVPANLP